MSKGRKTVLEYRSYALSSEFPLLVLTGEQWHISPQQSPRLHFHNCLEIGICHSESGTMIMGGEELPFEKGCVTFVGQNVPHTTWSAPGKYSLWSYIYTDPLPLVWQELTGRIPDLRTAESMVLNSHFILHPNSSPWAMPICEQILQEWRDRTTGYQLYIRCLLTLLLLQMLRQGGEQDAGRKRDRALVSIAPALDYIQANYMLDFPMDSLAEMCCLSPTHFRRVFLSLIGTSPLSYLHQIRILKSCGMMRRSEQSIAEIAAQAGYMSLSSYNRHFMEIMNCTPSACRKTGGSALSAFTGWTKAETEEEIIRSGPEAR